MTEAAFLQAILADPFDEAVRLVYADWLGEDGQAERAASVRDGRRRTLEAALLTDPVLMAWAIRLCPAFALLPMPVSHTAKTRYVIRLGFVEEVALTLAEFQLYAAGVASHDLTVTLGYEARSLLLLQAGALPLQDGVTRQATDSSSSASPRRSPRLETLRPGPRSWG